MHVSEEVKATVAEWRASGLTAEEFVSARGLSRVRLWGWSSRVLKAERKASGGDVVPLAQVMRRPPAENVRATVTVEVGDVRVVVQPGVDRATLAMVLDA